MSRIYLPSILCLFLVVGCREIPQPSGSWHEVESPTDKDLYSVFALSEDNAWAVGDSGVIIHWDGETWSLVESPTSERLNSVYFVSPDDGWVVGNSGIILHWNGSMWRVEDSPVSVDLSDVQFLSRNDGWAVGDSGVILHCNGQVWRIAYREECDCFKSLWFNNPVEGWAVSTVIWHYYNGLWSIDSTSLTFYGYFFDVNFIESDKGWAVGEWAIDCGQGRGAVYCFDNNEWKFVSMREVAPIQNYWLSVFFISENEGWIAGADDEMAGVEGAENMLHYKDGEWQVVNIENYRSIYSIHFSTPNNGWAVGKKGYILKYRR